MKTEMVMMNDVNFVVEEKSEKIKAIVKFQAVYDLDKLQELITEVTKKNDGTFQATLE